MEKRELTAEEIENLITEKGIFEITEEYPEIVFNESKEEYTAVNRHIKELRLENNLTQTDLAKILDISQREYWRYEQEGYAMSILKLVQIALFYNISLDWFSGYYPERKPFTENQKEIMVNGYLLSEVKSAKQNKQEFIKHTFDEF